MDSTQTEDQRAVRPRSAGVHLLQGLLMGTADIIPGVSGGTVALIVGIYERLVGSIHHAASAAAAFLRRDGATARGHLGAVDWNLIVPLGVGIATALGVASFVIPPLLDRYPSQMLAVFFGLIAGSLVVPWRRVDAPGIRPAALAVAAAVVAAILVGLPPRAVSDPALPMVFASAAVAICAMILPGISGAFLLLVLGIYRATLHAISALDLPYLLVFACGAVLGLAVFSRLLAYLLSTHHSTTMAALVGLMAGSLRALWPWQADDRGLLAPPSDVGEIAVVVLLAVAGFAAVRVLVGFGGLDDSDETSPPGR